MWLEPVVLLLDALALGLVLEESLVGAQRGPFSVRPIEEVVQQHGYPIERHDIRTADGYILTYHRIPHGRTRNNTISGKRKVVLFCNGILLSSAATLTDRGDFAYSLADAGFDVWLGNYRGSMYSRRHVTLDPDRDAKFWDFSLHELGSEDLPASIDHILRVTGQQQLLYIGASMGTTMFWVLGATRPQYMAKVRAMVAIAPVARPSHSSLVNTWARYYTLHTGVTTLKSLNFNELFPYREATGAFIYLACTSYWLRPLCFRVLDVFGYLTGQDWDIDRLLEATKYGPAGISTKVVLHFMQIANARRFQQYDYGQARNLQVYNAAFPPQYDLKKVTCKSMFFIHSDADLIATKQDVQWLSEQLPYRPKRILEAVNHLGHFGLGLDRHIGVILVKPLVQYLSNSYLIK